MVRSMKLRSKSSLRGIFAIPSHNLDEQELPSNAPDPFEWREIGELTLAVPQGLP
jgi:hypothetical protein